MHRKNPGPPLRPPPFCRSQCWSHASYYRYVPIDIHIHPHLHTFTSIRIPVMMLARLLAVTAGVLEKSSESTSLCTHELGATTLFCPHGLCQQMQQLQAIWEPVMRLCMPPTHLIGKAYNLLPLQPNNFPLCRGDGEGASERCTDLCHIITRAVPRTIAADLYPYKALPEYQIYLFSFTFIVICSQLVLWFYWRVRVNAVAVQPFTAYDKYCKLTEQATHQTTSIAPSDSWRFVVTGVGLYPRTSFLNHSCQPNAVITTHFTDSQHVVQATQDIAVGTEICISYVEQSLSQEQRHKHLRQEYFFQCHSCPQT